MRSHTILAIVFSVIAVTSGQTERPTTLETFVPIVLVHGGAGNIADEAIPSAKLGVRRAARAGYEKLELSGSVLDAVEQAVRVMEIDTQFNCGHGSVLTWDGKVEMDAAIMDGLTLDGGCVSVVQNVYHPIHLARRVMENTRHKYLAAEGAMKFAEEDGFEILPDGSLVTPRALKALEDFKASVNYSENALTDIPHPFYIDPVAEEPIAYMSQGTVGAVAIDQWGNVAAATSTGGTIGKMSGRIGDSPILGGGTYADNAMGALSATGHGETIMRYNLASRILAHITYEGKSAQEAVTLELENMTKRFQQTAGVISIDPQGKVGIHFTSKRMSWAYQQGEYLFYGVDKGENLTEIVQSHRIDFL